MSDWVRTSERATTSARTSLGRVKEERPPRRSGTGAPEAPNLRRSSQGAAVVRQGFLAALESFFASMSFWLSSAFSTAALTPPNFLSFTTSPVIAST